MIRKNSMFLAFLIAMTSTVMAQAANTGPLLARDILEGAGSGAIAGFSAGLLTYGLASNTQPGTILTGAAYGFLGGALLGAGVGFYQIANNQNNTDFSLSGYLAGGTGIGALIGGVVAIIPYTHDNRGEDFTVGIGLGGVVGALLGLGVAAIDLSSHPMETKLLSGTIIIHPESVALASLIPEISVEPMVTCRLVKVVF